MNKPKKRRTEKMKEKLDLKKHPQKNTHQEKETPPLPEEVQSAKITAAPIKVILKRMRKERGETPPPEEVQPAKVETVPLKMMTNVSMKTRVNAAMEPTATTDIPQPHVLRIANLVTAMLEESVNLDILRVHVVPGKETEAVPRETNAITGIPSKNPLPRKMSSKTLF